MMCVRLIKPLKNTTEKNREVLIVFDDMIAITLSNKKLDSIVTIIYRRQKSKHFSFFFLHKPKLQQIAFSYSSDINFKGFMNLYKKLLQNHILFLVIHATVGSDNILHFRKTLLERI